MAVVSSDAAVDYIQERILKGEYPMGYALNTRILAAEIGISRTPVREALRRLEAKGLVEIVPHFGANVRSLQLGEFIEMCAMRQALEGYLAGTAAQAGTEANVRELGSIVESMSRLIEEMAKYPEREAVLLEAIGREDIRFHVAIMSTARNKFITREVLRLHLISRVAISNAPEIPEKTEDPAADRRGEGPPPEVRPGGAPGDFPCHSRSRRQGGPRADGAAYSGDYRRPHQQGQPRPSA